MKHEWILTDDDSCQYMRKLDGGRWEGIEIRMVPGNWERHRVLTGTVDLDAYSDDELEELASLYGHTLSGIRGTYGQDAAQILAEIVFECGYFPPSFVGSRKECESFTDRYVRDY